MIVRLFIWIEGFVANIVNYMVESMLFTENVQLGVIPVKYCLFASLLLVLILPACSSEKTTIVSNAPSEKANVTHKPTLDVEVKVSGRQATVLIHTDLVISKEHYSKEAVPGEGHIHMYLDNGEKQGITNSQYTLTDLGPGTHSLKVSLHNNDHTPYDVQKTVQFSIQ